MQKIVIHSPGSYDRLKLESHPKPEPKAGEVRVRTTACGVNYADCVVRMGLYESAKKYVGWPITPGFEFAGTVDAVGADVDGWKEGDRVFGVTRFGGYASHMVVPAHQLFRIPTGWTDAQAAAFPAVHLTAWFALFELAHPRPGARVLIHSAAGGVGSALVTLARIAGCRPVGVVGASHKVEAVKALGAEEVIDKSRVDLWKTAEAIAPDGYDVVLDANGVATLAQSYAHLASPGKLVVYGFHSMLPHDGRLNWLKLAKDWLRTPRFSPLRMTNENRSVLAFNLSYLFERSELLLGAMDTMLEWSEAGKLAPPQVTTFALADVAQAHRSLESGQTIGKLVLIP